METLTISQVAEHAGIGLETVVRRDLPSALVCEDLKRDEDVSGLCRFSALGAS